MTAKSETNTIASTGWRAFHSDTAAAKRDFFELVAKVNFVSWFAAAPMRHLRKRAARRQKKMALANFIN